MVKVSPSLLAANYAHAASDLRKAERGNPDSFHLDVMDGHFVSNISFGADYVKDLRTCSKKPFCVHLMICEPRRFLKSFAEQLKKNDTISFHIEAVPHPKKTNSLDLIKKIRAFGLRAGIAIDLNTPAAEVKSLLPFVDEVTVMTVKAGFGGQDFQKKALKKIRWLRQKIDEKKLKTQITVDGGIGKETGKLAAHAGAHVLAVGTSVFKARDPARAVRQLKAIKPLKTQAQAPERKGR